MEKKEIVYLPLGSMIRIEEEAKKKFMIVVRSVIIKDEIFMPSYLVAPHPDGDIGDNVLIVDDDHIAEVLFLGYQDEADFANLKRKVEALENEEDSSNEEQESGPGDEAEKSASLIPFQKYRGN